MKYEMKRKQHDDAFEPFTVSITFETNEEYTFFHDKIMGEITQCGSHEFHGHLYNMGSGNLKSAKGTIKYRDAE